MGNKKHNSGDRDSDGDSESSGAVAYPSKAEKNKVGEQEDRRVIFRENRSFDLHLASRVVKFEGHGIGYLTGREIESSQFKSVSGLFNVLGV